MATINSIRARIVALQAERAAIEAQPFSREVMRARVAAYAAGLAADATARLRHVLVTAAKGDPLVNLFVGYSQTANRVSLDAALVALLGPDAWAASVLQHVDAVPVGLEPAERAARLAAIAADLDHLETEEEHIIEQSELECAPIPRRADARPEIVLAVPV